MFALKLDFHGAINSGEPKKKPYSFRRFKGVTVELGENEIFHFFHREWHLFIRVDFHTKLLKSHKIQI